ncbi:Uma2 family endonuclease [Pseudonocardia endophytica]|uniref:Uma2 family endonuclease n=1 Tax=Pseudonocardia endophytica TaxID=401976 RepID=A0A4R1HRU3_PSEEN|nr:Uma2 family endonuclease [Pseudonocardia endophytica]TCK20092.1 Uma2 family endonuclease [Pseudonocardia endophytica]
MSAEPVRSASGIFSTRPVPPPHPLTVAEYLDVGEAEPGRTELAEGQLLMSSGPVPDHIHAGMEIAYQLRGQVPPEWEALTEPDIDLQLAPPDAPGTVRRADVVVVTREARRRVRAERGFIRASEVVVAVEVLSPGSVRTDHVVKRSEYADAGIPHYWIVDLSEPVSLLACHLAGEFGYADGGVVTGTYSATTPFPVALDLDALL